MGTNFKTKKSRKSILERLERGQKKKGKLSPGELIFVDNGDDLMMAEISPGGYPALSLKFWDKDDLYDEDLVKKYVDEFGELI